MTPYYIDPIHDFALYRFDVENLQGLPLRLIKLRPDLVEVGLEICIRGNDVRQVMCILPGIDSQVDYNPPQWDTSKVRHAPSGGSSGSPVVNNDGFTAALMSGGFTSASTDDTSLVKGLTGSVTFSTRELKVEDKTAIYGLKQDGLGPCALNSAINVDVLHLARDSIYDDTNESRNFWRSSLVMLNNTNPPVKIRTCSSLKRTSSVELET